MKFKNYRSSDIIITLCTLNFTLHKEYQWKKEINIKNITRKSKDSKN